MIIAKQTDVGQHEQLCPSETLFDPNLVGGLLGDRPSPACLVRSETNGRLNNISIATVSMGATRDVSMTCLPPCDVADGQ